MQDVVEEIDKGTLSREEYPYVKDPAGSSGHHSSSSPSSRPPVNPASKPSVISKRTVGRGGGTTWASKGRAPSDDGYSRSITTLFPLVRALFCQNFVTNLVGLI